MSFAVALSFAKAGVRIIPVKVFRDGDRWRKLPYINLWRQRASDDPSVIEEWWCQFPDAVPGIVLEHYGRVVVDCDRHGGPDGVAAFASLGPFPPHPIVKTAGNGEHHYFLQPDPPIEGKFVPFEGIEVMGINRFVCAPGSAGYELVADAPAPVLPEVFRVKRTKRQVRSPDYGNEEVLCECVHDDGGPAFEPTRNFHVRMKAIVKWLSRAKPGGRTNTLFASACLMAEMEAFEGKPTRTVAEHFLMLGCRANGLIAYYGKAKCKDTIDDAYRRISARYPTPSITLTHRTPSMQRPSAK
jgi:hypothetical protein